MLCARYKYAFGKVSLMRLSEAQDFFGPKASRYIKLQEGDSVTIEVISETFKRVEKGESDLLDNPTRFACVQLLVKQNGEERVLNVQRSLGAAMLEQIVKHGMTQGEEISLAGSVWNLSRKGRSEFVAVCVNPPKQAKRKERKETKEESAEIACLRKLQGMPVAEEALPFYLEAHLNIALEKAREIISELVSSKKISFKDGKLQVA